jgi:hypothetical protein
LRVCPKSCALGIVGILDDGISDLVQQRGGA